MTELRTTADADCSIAIEYPSAHATMPDLELDISAHYRWFRFRYDFLAKVVAAGVQRSCRLRWPYFSSRLWLFDDNSQETIFWKPNFLTGSSFWTMQGEKIGELKTTSLSGQEMVLRDCRCNTIATISLVKSMSKRKEFKAQVPSGFDIRLLLGWMTLEFYDDIYGYVAS